jgi:hypothetical protein
MATWRARTSSTDYVYNSQFLLNVGLWDLGRCHVTSICHRLAAIVSPSREEYCILWEFRKIPQKERQLCKRDWINTEVWYHNKEYVRHILIIKQSDITWAVQCKIISFKICLATSGMWQKLLFLTGFVSFLCNLPPTLFKDKALLLSNNQHYVKKNRVITKEQSMEDKWLQWRQSILL